MLDVAVYLYTAGYHLLDPRDTQYGHKVTCHFLMIPTLLSGSETVVFVKENGFRQNNREAD